MILINDPQLVSSDKNSIKTKLLPIVTAAHVHVTKNLSKDELQQLHELLSKLYSSVKDEYA